MKTEIIKTAEQFAKLEAAWREIETIDPDVSFYSTFSVVKAWWDSNCRKGNLQLFIVVVWDTTKIVGIAPLMIERSKALLWSWKTLKFLGMGDFFGLLIDNSFPKPITVIKEIMKVLEENQHEWDRLVLNYIGANSLFAAYLFKSKYNKNLQYSVECPCLELKKYQSLEQYNQYFKPANAKKICEKLRQHTACQLVVSHYDEEVFKKIVVLHQKEQDYLARQMGRKNQKSLFADPLLLDFVVETSRKCPENVLFFILKDGDDRFIAYGLCYLYKGILHWWNCGYDPEFEKYSPVKALILEMIRYLFETPIANVLDFGAGRYFWKFEWTNNFVLNYQLSMWNQRKKTLLWLYKLERCRCVLTDA